MLRCTESEHRKETHLKSVHTEQCDGSKGMIGLAMVVQKEVRFEI